MIVACRRYEWSPSLCATVASGFGFRAVYRDGTRGPVRKTFAAARRDARDGATARRREDSATREGTGS